MCYCLYRNSMCKLSNLFIFVSMVFSVKNSAIKRMNKIRGRGDLRTSFRRRGTKFIEVDHSVKFQISQRGIYEKNK